MLRKRQIKKALEVYAASLLYHNPFASTMLSIDEDELVNKIRLEMAEKLLKDESPFNETDDISIKYLNK